MIAVTRQRLLVTGGSGLVGSHLVPHLSVRHDVTVADVRRPGYDAGDFVACDVADLTPEAFKNREFDQVIHLAAVADEEQPLTDDMVWANIVGMERTMRFAAERKIPKFIFAASCQAFIATDPWELVGDDAPYRPASVYGVTKIFGESLGLYYADQCDMTFLALRIGAMLPEDWERDLLEDEEYARLWLSPRDMCQVFSRAVETPFHGWHAVFATSRVDPPYLSLDEARRLLGYEPKDRFREYYRGETPDGGRTP